MKMRSVIWHIDFDAECAKSGLVIALELSLHSFYREYRFHNIKKKKKKKKEHGEYNNYETTMTG